MTEILLSVTFSTGLFVAVMHVANGAFVAPVYDVIANITGFVCASAASALMQHWVSAALAAGAVGCWLWLARRTGRVLSAVRQGTAH